MAQALIGLIESMNPQSVDLSDETADDILAGPADLSRCML